MSRTAWDVRNRSDDRPWEEAFVVLNGSQPKTVRVVVPRRLSLEFTGCHANSLVLGFSLSFSLNSTV